MVDAPPLRLRAHRERNAGQTMAEPCTLACFPDDVSEEYLPFKLTLRQRQRADLFSREQYFHGVKIFKAGNKFDVTSRCFRSQLKRTPCIASCLLDLMSSQKQLQTL